MPIRFNRHHFLSFSVKEYNLKNNLGQKGKAKE
jgi:hypothetical protein